MNKILTIALAYLGVVVGAGFASGKEIEQYYVTFGIDGLWGGLLSTVIYGFVAYIALQFGSYYRAHDHSTVLDKIAPPFISKILDWITSFTLFALGMTMIAGGGSNLQQQFGWDLWIGASLVAIAIILAGYFDIDRVTKLIGYLTPLIIVFFLVIPIYAYMTTDLNLAEADQISQSLTRTLPHWTVSAFNHVSLNFMLVFSMATVMGGDEENIRKAGIGGGFGGAWIGILQLLGYIAIFLKVDVAGGTPMPLLALADDMHPIFGLLMMITIFLMIISTAIGMFYPLSQRIYNMTTKDRSFFDNRKFQIILISCVLVAFLFSFVGFETFVAYVYPVIGYSGLILMGILIYAWIKKRADISKEMKARESYFENKKSNS